MVITKPTVTYGCEVWLSQKKSYEFWKINIEKYFVVQCMTTNQAFEEKRKNMKLR